MSCGKPHETDCSEVLREVWLLLDQECDSAQRHKLVEHLDECSPCLEQYGIEEHLKLLLARKCGGDKVPEGFKDRVRQSIRETVRRAQISAADGSTVEVTETRVEVRREPS